MKVPLFHNRFHVTRRCTAVWIPVLAVLLTLAVLAGSAGRVKAQTYPTIIFDSGPADAETIYSTEVTFTFHSDPAGAALECDLMTFPSNFWTLPTETGWYDCTSPHTLTGLTRGGLYGFGVRPKGGLDETVVSRAWMIGFSPVIIDSGPEPMTYSTEATFTFHSDPAAPMECAMGIYPLSTPAWYDCTSPQTFTGLTPGASYTFKVKTNGTPDQLATGFMWNIGIPDVFIDSHPAETTTSTEATFTFHSNPAGIPLECAFVSQGSPEVTWYDCTSPQTFTGLTYGMQYAFGVKPKIIPEPYPMAYYDWTIVPPVPVIDSGPSGISYSTEATFTFHSDPAAPAYQCALVPSGVAPVWEDCASPKTYTGLTYGTAYGFLVKVKTDPGVAIYNDSRIFTVTLPAVTIDSGPPSTAYSSEATFTFHSAPAGVPLECIVVTMDSIIVNWHDCTSPKTVTGLTPGINYAFGVKPKGAPDNTTTIYPWTVDKHPQTITFGSLAARTYGDAPFTVSATAGSGLPVSFSAAGPCAVSGSTVTITGAGSCTVTASQNGDASWYPAAPVAQTFNIARKAASVTVANKSKTYGDDNPALTATVVGQVAGGDAIRYTLSTTAVRYSGVGSYPITVTLGSNPNYTVTATDGTLAVTPRIAAVTTNDKSKTYGEVNPALDATVTGTVNGETVNYTLATAAEQFSNVGAYPIVVTLGTNPNYNVSKTDGTLAVNPRAATVTANDKSKTYGDDNPALDAVTGGTVHGDVLNYSLSTTAIKLSDAGDYPIVVTLGGNQNYTVVTTDGTLTIDRKDASVTANYQSITYGDNIPVLTASVEGEVAGGDAIHYTLSTTAKTCANIGDYPIVVTLGDNPNYNVTKTDSILAINRKPASVTANDTARTYGTENPEFTATVVGEEESCAAIHFSLSTTATRLSGVGPYPIVVTLGSNNNYRMTTADGTLTVAPAPLTVTPDDWERGYGDPNPDELTFTYTGWIEGEGPTSPYLTTAPTCSTSREPLSPAGTYPITCSGGVAPNYEFIYDMGMFTVTKETAAITYTGDTQATTAKAGAKVTVTLAATLEEEQDGTLGNQLAGQQISFEVLNFGGTPAASCTATIGSVKDGKGYGSCTVSLGAADPYLVRIRLVDNPYYTAEEEEVVVLVNNPGAGMTAGGGWLVDPNTGRRASFGVTAKFLKNGNVQGNSLYIYRVTTDLSALVPGAPEGLREYNWIIKSNAMNSLNITNCPKGARTGCKATLTGKNTIQAVDRLTGVTYSLGGNYQFQVDVVDNREPASPASAAADGYAIRVWNASGVYYVLGSTYDKNGSLLAPLAISGGNLQVKAK